jgi:hypothetical protein
MGRCRSTFAHPFGRAAYAGVLGRVGRWTLVAIVLGLALIGFLHLTRGTAVRHVRGVSSDGSPIAVGEPEFPLMATMATGAWLAPGNRVEVLLDGDDTYPRLWDDLRSAKQSITLQLYYGAPGRMADTLGQILIERAKAGVRVTMPSGPSTCPQAIATRSEPGASWSGRSGRSGSPRSISHRIARTFGASSSTVVSDGPEASASTTNGLAMDGRMGPGGKPMCASRVQRLGRRVHRAIPPRFPSLLDRYFQNAVRLTAEEQKQLAAGQAVTKLLDADESKEVAVFGAIWINVPMRRYTDAVKQIENFGRGGGFKITKRISSPPRLDDFALLGCPRTTLPTSVAVALATVKSSAANRH